MTTTHTTPMSERGEQAHRFFLSLQDEITRALEILDGHGSFRADEWARPGGGGGRSRVLLEGGVIEKGGVNVSCVHGTLPEHFAKEVHGHAGREFFATGLSLVVHPRSPRVPTVHANFRYLERGEGGSKIAWYGGGADLTPWILYPEDAAHFHRTWAEVCGRHPGVADYKRFKKWCDEYFFLPHRKETRGIGGIFFDDLGVSHAGEADALSLSEVEAFVFDAGRHFLAAYLPIATRRQNEPVIEDERTWQLERRGRYVEFNLLYDRGTTFGLKTDGRTESILMSMPPVVRWSYAKDLLPDTYQSELVDALTRPRDWYLPDADANAR